MIDLDRFESIKARHARYASWAVWSKEGTKAKDGVGDLSVFEAQNLLTILDSTTVLVGLNISRLLEADFKNFHDDRSQSQDYKLRYALTGTELWGAYMTDVIKDFDEKSSGRMMSYLSQNKGFEEKNISLFLEELDDLGAQKPRIVAFGADAFSVLKRNLGSSYEIRKLGHYANYISKEKYRASVEDAINSWSK